MCPFLQNRNLERGFIYHEKDSRIPFGPVNDFDTFRL